MERNGEVRGLTGGAPRISRRARACALRRRIASRSFTEHGPEPWTFAASGPRVDDLFACEFTRAACTVHDVHRLLDALQIRHLGRAALVDDRARQVRSAAARKWTARLGGSGSTPPPPPPPATCTRSIPVHHEIIVVAREKRAHSPGSPMSWPSSARTSPSSVRSRHFRSRVRASASRRAGGTDVS